MSISRIAAVAISICLSQGLPALAGQAVPQPASQPAAKPLPPARPDTGKQATDPKSVQPPKEVNADAVLLVDFKSRVDKYLELKKQAAGEAPPLKQTENPAEIKAAQTGLAKAIRARRADAKPGDIFTPDISQHFRRLLTPTTKGEDGHDARQVMKDDAPAAVPLKVNADYPEEKTLPTVPAKMLLNMPTLPKGLDFRIVNGNLILRDVDANIIVDFMMNAVK